MGVALRFFENAMQSGLLQMPNEQFRDLQQAAIDDMWEVTTAKHTVLEQDAFGPLTFHEVEVWFDYVVGVTSTFAKNGNDYRKLIFRSIDHWCDRGRYYKFEGSYWLADFTDPMITVQKFLTVRRCNNWLRMIDPENGAIVQWPCVVDYDATSPSPQVSSDIILPNNHLSVLVQGNAETSRLFKLNTRFMLGGRPFKLQAYQNALMPNDSTEQTNLLYLDLYLDELHDEDNQELQLADNGEFNYSVQIDSVSKDIKVAVGREGQFNAVVLLNGQGVTRDVVWASSAPDTVFVDDEGKYMVKSNEPSSVTVTATLQGNEQISDSIQIEIVNQDELVPVVNIIPDFTKIRQYEIIEFKVEMVYNEQVVEGFASFVNLDNNNYLSIQDMGDNKYTIKALNIAKETQLMHVSVESADKSITATMDVPLQVVSLMG